MPATAPALSTVGPNADTINIICVTTNTVGGYLAIDYQVGLKDLVTGVVTYQPQSFTESWPIGVVRTIAVMDATLPIFENARRAAYALLLPRLQAKGLFSGAVVK